MGVRKMKKGLRLYFSGLLWMPNPAHRRGKTGFFLNVLHFGRTFQHVPSIYVTKKATIQTLFLTLYRGFLHGRSGETRTRGLLLPKQARYQLRNTPEKYYHSILFFCGVRQS